MDDRDLEAALRRAFASRAETPVVPAERVFARIRAGRPRPWIGVAVAGLAIFVALAALPTVGAWLTAGPPATSSPTLIAPSGSAGPDPSVAQVTPSFGTEPPAPSPTMSPEARRILFRLSQTDGGPPVPGPNFLVVFTLFDDGTATYRGLRGDEPGPVESRHLDAEQVEELLRYAGGRDGIGDGEVVPAPLPPLPTREPSSWTTFEIHSESAARTVSYARSIAELLQADEPQLQGPRRIADWLAHFDRAPWPNIPPPATTRLLVAGTTSLTGEFPCGLGGCAYFLTMTSNDGGMPPLERELSLTSTADLWIPGRPPLLPPGGYETSIRAVSRSDICDPECALLGVVSSCSISVEVPLAPPIILLDVQVDADDCTINPVVNPEGPNVVPWRVDPDGRFPGDYIDILVSDPACSGGRSAAGRIDEPLVIYGPRTVTVTISVMPLPGINTCQGNPETPYRLELRELIDGRDLVDGSRSSGFAPYPGVPWTDAGGTPVSSDTVTLFRATCLGFTTNSLLHVRWPLPLTTESVEHRQYWRDPQHVGPASLVGTFAIVELPDDAVWSGYHIGDLELWFSPTDHDLYAYVTYGHTVERWPRSVPEYLCG